MALEQLQQYVVPYLISNLIALLVLIFAWRKPTVGRIALGFIFLLASIVNTREAIIHPSSYLLYEQFALLTLYRDFIAGWFSEHVRAMVVPIAFGQMVIAVGMFVGGRCLKLAIIGVVIFGLAIAPLGVGSAFPCSGRAGDRGIVAVVSRWQVRRDAVRRVVKRNDYNRVFHERQFSGKLTNHVLRADVFPVDTALRARRDCVLGCARNSPVGAGLFELAHLHASDGSCAFELAKRRQRLAQNAAADGVRLQTHHSNNVVHPRVPDRPADLLTFSWMDEIAGSACAIATRPSLGFACGVALFLSVSCRRRSWVDGLCGRSVAGSIWGTPGSTHAWGDLVNVAFAVFLLPIPRSDCPYFPVADPDRNSCPAILDIQ